MRKITSAILLAAGRGKRLRPHTNHTPKPLLPWRDRPTLDWILDSLLQSEVTQVVLVTGHLRSQIEEYSKVRMQQYPAQQIACVTQTVLDGTAAAVSCALHAHPQWFKQSFLVTATDYLVASGFYPDLLAFHEQHKADISISLKSVPQEELASRSSVAYSGDFDITEVVEKPKPGQAPSCYSANLIYVVPAAMAELIHAVLPSPRGEREFQTAVNTHLQNGASARGLLQQTPQEWLPGTS